MSELPAAAALIGPDEDTLGYLEAAGRRGIPVEALPGGAVQLGWGAAAIRMRGSASGATNVLAFGAADDILVGRRLLAGAKVPLPDGEVVTGIGQAVAVAARIGWPVTLRPLDGAGAAVSGIADDAAVRRCCAELAALSPRGIAVEEHRDGDECRLLVVGGRLLAAAGLLADVTALVHPENTSLVQRAARVIGLDIAGVDLRSTDISRSWRETGGVITAVNAYPSLEEHRLADPDRDIYGEVLDVLFGGRPARIPVTALTGDGAAAAAGLLHHILATAGVLAGVCTTEGVRIGADAVSAAELSGRIVLTDPAVQSAIVELPSAGLHCDRYDVAAVLPGDGLSAGRAEALEKAVTVVLRADDRDWPQLQAAAGSQRWTLVADNAAAVAEHRAGGGAAVFIGAHDGGAWISYAVGGAETPLAPVRGFVAEELSHAMVAAALAHAHGIEPETICTAMKSWRQ